MSERKSQAPFSGLWLANASDKTTGFYGKTSIDIALAKINKQAPISMISFSIPSEFERSQHVASTSTTNILSNDFAIYLNGRIWN